MKVSKALLHPAAKPVLFVAALLPFAWLAYGAVTDNLGANPQEHLIRSLGDWSLPSLHLRMVTVSRWTACRSPSTRIFMRRATFTMCSEGLTPLRT